MGHALDAYRESEFDLDELVAAAATFVSRLVPASADGRISAVPDARTLRYYQTLGITSRPLRYEGRQAVYGYEHLLQIVCVKLMQARGFSLAQVQRTLAAAPRSQLEAAIDEAEQGRGGAAYPAAAGPLRYERQPTAAVIAEDEWPAPEDWRRGNVAGEPTPHRRPRQLVAAEVAPGVSVTIDTARVRSPELLLARIARAIDEQDGGSQ